MGKKEEIFEYCEKRGCELTAMEIVEALYPGKEQPHVNSEITSLIKSKKLVRNDDVRPYTVRLPCDGESPQTMKSNMEKELLELIEEFRDKLTKYQYNQYAIKLRDYLVPYLIKEHPKSNLKILFENEFTRNDIINSTVYYIENNKNVKRISAIDDFLTALNRFFVELIFSKYNNQNVRNLIPLNKLNTEINRILKSKGISLLEKETDPPVDADQYKAIITFLENYSKVNKLHAYQDPIIIKLMLLYGFSTDRMAKLEKDSYDINRNTLLIVNPKDARQDFKLELPYCFNEEFKKLFEFKSKNLKFNSKYLFVNEKNNMIKNDVVSRLLEKIKTEFQNENRVEFQKDNKVEIQKDDKLEFKKNPFTPTGLQKYAIIQMILAGMNQTIITEFTGQKESILLDCQLEVNKDNSIERTRYVNYKIRRIVTYDEMQ